MILDIRELAALLNIDLKPILNPSDQPDSCGNEPSK